MIQFGDIFDLFQTQFQSQILNDVIQIVIAISPILLAFILFLLFWPLWLDYIRGVYFLKEKTTLIEIRLPKDIYKSPVAMEVFLSSLHQVGGEATWYDKYWLGKTRPWFSIEMVSIEGQIHLYIWTRKSQKSFIETNLYAQFPGIEVHEADDYTKSVAFDPKEQEMFVCEFELVKPDPYPIKTYIDYGLDKDPKEEYKVDPMVPLIEYLGSVGHNQQTWIQIVIRAHKKEQTKPGFFWKKTDAWKDEAEKIINDTLQRDPKTKVSGKKDAESKRVEKPTLTENEKDTMSAIERKTSKFGFDVGMRAVYLAKKDFYDATNIGKIFGSFKNFGSEGMNGIKPNGDVLLQKFSYPWQDIRGKKKTMQKMFGLDLYKKRAFFYRWFYHPPKTFVLNTEELATIFHFPGQTAFTPTLTRVPSKKAEPPANLPLL